MRGMGLKWSTSEGIKQNPERVSSLGQYFSSEIHVLDQKITIDHVLFQVYKTNQVMTSLKTNFIKISNGQKKFRNVP